MAQTVRALRSLCAVEQRAFLMLVTQHCHQVPSSAGHQTAISSGRTIRKWSRMKTTRLHPSKSLIRDLSSSGCYLKPSSIAQTHCEHHVAYCVLEGSAPCFFFSALEFLMRY